MGLFHCLLIVLKIPKHFMPFSHNNVSLFFSLFGKSRCSPCHQVATLDNTGYIPYIPIDIRYAKDQIMVCLQKILDNILLLFLEN